MTHPWPELRWWNSGERQVVEEKIDDLVKKGTVCCPTKACMYRALTATPFGETRVAIIGQDPYPTEGIATGIAFSVGKGVTRDKFPGTLRIVLGEYSSDLGYPAPSCGDLLPWTRQGVLLWNAVPSVQSGHPLSNDWDEWRYLTGEIIDRLNERGGVVFVFVGAVAARYEKNVTNLEANRVIRTSHPSPRGVRASRTPFTGSRVFSTVNARMAEIGAGRIDWELKDEPAGKGDVQGPDVVRGKVLPNITGVRLGGLKTTGTSRNIYTSLLF